MPVGYFLFHRFRMYSATFARGPALGLSFPLKVRLRNYVHPRRVQRDRQRAGLRHRPAVLDHQELLKTGTGRLEQEVHTRTGIDIGRLTTLQPRLRQLALPAELHLLLTRADRSQLTLGRRGGLSRRRSQSDPGRTARGAVGVSGRARTRARDGRGARRIRSDSTAGAGADSVLSPARPGRRCRSPGGRRGLA